MKLMEKTTAMEFYKIVNQNVSYAIFASTFMMTISLNPQKKYAFSFAAYKIIM